MRVLYIQLLVVANAAAYIISRYQYRNSIDELCEK